MSALKVVLDSNILVSILQGSPKLTPIDRAFREDRLQVVISAELITELSLVLYKPSLKIDGYLIKELFRLIRVKAVRVKVPSPFIHACRDHKDNFILELAVTGKANYIVTGDKDLLILNPFRGIPILSPHRFIDELSL